MRCAVILLALVCSTTAAAQQPTDTSRSQKRVIQMPGSTAGLPLSSAVQVGNIIYLSGQVGVLPGTRQLVDTGVTKQTQQTLDNIKAVLTYAGSALERVFKCTVFLANIRDFDDMNRVYTTYFPKDPPARSTVAGSGLALGAKVEIECMATAGS